jgi:hypothetical protein
MNWIAKQWHTAWANYYASKIESLDKNEDMYNVDVRTHHSKKFISHYEALYGNQNQVDDESMLMF